MTIQDTCLHHKHVREREQLGPNNKSAVTSSEPVEPRTEQDPPGPNTKLNVEEILTDLEHYHPRRKDGPGGTCRKRESTWATSITGTCPPR
ncbi:D-ornithine 4,5-aminomutase [Cutibacterium acnes JCM 18920]|nr:D-ornithine 4,5-aminomutase [Cutibacterium acnes JCM 18920]